LITRLAICSIVLCAALAGCAILGGRHAGALRGSAGAAAGSPSPPTGSDAAKLAQARATHEYPSSRPPAQTAADAGFTAVQAVRRFATAYINWNAQSVAGDMRALALESIRQARSAMALAAAQTAGDYELRSGGIANSGTVEAIAPLQGHADQYVVVTREATTATNTTAYAGLLPAWHLAIATVTRLQSGGWVLSGWQPES
jgi:hypothetical protein